jgi:hypothetical protein
MAVNLSKPCICTVLEEEKKRGGRKEMMGEFKSIQNKKKNKRFEKLS